MREEYSTLDEALRTFPWFPDANVEVIRATVADLDVAKIYVPPKRSYIALVPSDGGPIVAIHYGYISGLRDENGKRTWRALPENRIREGGYTVRGEDDRDPCPECNLLLPLTGLCDSCY